jgi:hypothetical protein
MTIKENLKARADYFNSPEAKTLCAVCSQTILMTTYRASHGTCGKPSCLKIINKYRPNKEG